MGDDDRDRDAILERRRQLIALALSGLGTWSGCDVPPPAPAEPTELAADPSEPAAPEPIEDVAPIEPVEPPHAEVIEAEAPTEAAARSRESTPNDPSEVAHAEERKRRVRARRRWPGPQVCLSVLKGGSDPDDEPRS